MTHPHYFLTSHLVLNVLSTLVVLAAIAFTVWWFWPKRKATQGNCPNCNIPLHPIRSQYLKMCSSCEYTEPWQLKPGQKPLIRNNRSK